MPDLRPINRPGAISRPAKRRLLLAGLALLVAILLARDGLGRSLQGVEIEAPRITQREAARSQFLSAPPARLDDATFRSVAEIRGTFSLNDLLIAQLYFVRGNAVERGDSLLAGRKNSAPDAAFWAPFAGQLTLGEVDGPGGSFMHLGSSGFPFVTGFSGHSIRGRVRPRMAKTLPGPLGRGGEQIVFVVGDRHFDVTPGMSVAEFARRNAGDFAIVALRLE